MPDNKRAATNYQYAFPQIPRKWSHDEMQFAQGLRRLFDALFSRKELTIKTIYPVGSVVFSVNSTAPYNTGTWEEITLDMTGIHAWKRTA